jgi:hypothetical protein
MLIGEAETPLLNLGRPTNRKDPRLAGFESKYGDGFPSFELDIIPPPVLRGIVQAAIEKNISSE